MRFSAVALFAFAVFTECLSAQSERSRHRSGPIRSVPVAADIKRDNDFDCPEEFGYYPHPTDCTLYYVCVFGGALLESCTGGLMYSHELQTCDWPRNVGCDGTSAVRAEEVERIPQRDRDREPPPPPPRRVPTSPPPLPRAQPNPVVTSRGQPKFNRDEYEKQQQLYAEVDDLPPVEEIESDRQQRVYRGQPSTIGQVQKDRDGYSSQVVSSRTLNTNVIPASIPQSSKVGSFSFGTQVNERRAATATPAPQTYSEDKSNFVTDSSIDRQIDVETNVLDVFDSTEKNVSRKKREVIEDDKAKSNLTNPLDKISDKSDVAMEYVESDLETLFSDDINDEDEEMQDETERGKRQIRYLIKNGYKNPSKNWANTKPIKFIDYRQLNLNSNPQSARYQQPHNIQSSNNYQDGNRKPFAQDSYYSTANPFLTYQMDTQSQRPFKPSLPDFFDDKSPHAPMNVATQIITKSPPISALKTNENPFSALAGGFFNNNGPTQNFNQETQKFNQFYDSQNVFPIHRPNNQASFQDSSLLPSTVVTGKPIQMQTAPRIHLNHRPVESGNQAQKELHNSGNHNNKYKQLVSRPPNNVQEYDDESEEEENDSSEYESSEENDDTYKSDFPKPPYEFTHPNHKYADIENPFANPNFDFDAYIAKLRNDPYDSHESTPKPKPKQNIAVTVINPTSDFSTEPSNNGQLRTSTYSHGMSTPRPFSGPDSVTKPTQFLNSTSTPAPERFQKIIQQQLPNHHNYQYFSDNNYRLQQNAGIPVEAVRPKLKPPNFDDDRQLPITYSFNRPIGSTNKPAHDKTKSETKQMYTVTQKPLVFFTSTSTPVMLSSPKQHYVIRPEKIITLQPQMGSTGKHYLISTVKPHNTYALYKQTTQKPLTTLANEQLSALHNYWNNLSTEPNFSFQTTAKPNAVSEMTKLENLFAQAVRSTYQTPLNNYNVFATSSTTKPSPKRRPIPKPSPEMNDYYYEEDEFYEPPVKSQYMPSSEVKPQRPHMAQNYKEYEDFDDTDVSSVTNQPIRGQYKRPIKYNTYKPETATKNHNDVSAVTKTPPKDSNKHGKINVLVEYGTPAPNVLMRPEISNYQIMHHLRNRTLHIRKPIYTESNPLTSKPPKFLNQTTLRPYTVRHRLAKPTTVKATAQNEDSKSRGRQRHHNIVAQMKLTTPRDNHNQETRFTKTKHDDKTNSLEPTESVTPTSYSASPRPKMLYNGSQNYSPDQYDPYYPVYDEDGELYKDTDYVQQYNTASLRPAVQQTYRGTPPPARRPVETYSPRPSQEDYDDALIHGQINNQNQYQTAIRQPNRGEGNELGYDHNTSGVRTTLYEATSISTTPSTTSTSTTTTTQRSTTAPITEAMTPSRYTPRSPTDENPISVPEIPSQTPSDGSASPLLTSSFSNINLSSLAKPFEKTDNSFRLQETLTTTDKKINPRLASHVTNRNDYPVEVVRSDKGDEKVGSQTTGFSIRRNPSNSNNPYTLTLITRPSDNFHKSRTHNANIGNRKQQNLVKSNLDYNRNTRDESIEIKEEPKLESSIKSSPNTMRRNDEIFSREEIPIINRSSRKKVVPNPRIKVTPTSATPPSTTSKYYLKTVIKRPAPFSVDNEVSVESTENTINTDAIIETGLQNVRLNNFLDKSSKPTQTFNKSPNWNQFDDSIENYQKPSVSPYKSLDNLRNSYQADDDTDVQDYVTTTTSTTRSIPTNPTMIVNNGQKATLQEQSSRPRYFTYSVDDERIPDHTTEVFSSTVKNIIKAFFNNFGSSPKPQINDYPSTSSSASDPEPEEKVVNIGYQKKTLQYVDEKPFKNNVNRLQIIPDPTSNRNLSPNTENINYIERDQDQEKDFSTTTTSTTTIRAPIAFSRPNITPTAQNPSAYNFYSNSNNHNFISKFNNLVTQQPETDDESNKFQKLLDNHSTERNYRVKNNNDDNEVTKLTEVNLKTNDDWNEQTSKVLNEFATTTSTTKATTLRVTPTVPTTKSLSFPTRASRVNPAIKLAAKNPGGGRRSYQSSSKCSSDNSLQANPKCNEIKYQRPTGTRGRGSAHYSTLSGSDGPQQPANRGTPPTRSRPTLKPSTVIVTNPNPVVDIYTHPPHRPAPVYPQPTPDKTAAKCRKDVCLLPDCYCGGRDIPGDLPVESVPQIVLLTFDDSVNDLNKGLYADLFEKDRVNPNGCPIAATFYVSHEWTDYSQVQNLYSAGHEMASHTISHSFGEQFSQKKWNREVGGQREILSAYGGVKLEDVRGMRAPFLSVGGNKMFKMLYDSNFTYDSSLPVYENRPPSWPYTLDYKLFHDCMIPPCPTKSYPGVWEVPMVMWQDLNGGRCSMGDACANPPEAEGVYKMLLKNFDRHYTTNRAPFGLYYHAAWFTQAHHKEGFIMFLDFINQMNDVWLVTNWQALQWVRDPTPISRLNNFQPFQCNYQDRPKKCNNPKVCNLWHKSGVRYMRTCQPCPEIYPWTGKSGIRSSRIDNDIEE